ncbi:MULTISPECIES: helix-turn-helix domain-containing protein [unclassified Bradyrhizobium]|jgi:hypothetical protein|uniref:helix-turn-helix domain-containing protein n=1 Tax=unclassified Bradyrhizobium TaxID=2631580 RepID=UPI001FFB025B|nr:MULTISPECIES: helix-turn-helix domain-containing protein [unclassified Bradyrhizobium]MCK1534653.1 helix-turn-helix domain-containing protein [Bradyrhizobium sp. 176]MCK1557890.1 helix-turn-helix domain-containing protein [Bradyrhizobium sp. 171]UPJ98260.1 helix-turn-helix domain-containing protein [Bradyrhizobium sp. 172]
MRNDQLMSPRQVTNELGVVYQTVRYWVSRGKLTPVSQIVGGHARFARADVEAIKAKGKRPVNGAITPPIEERPTSIEKPVDNSLAPSGVYLDERKTVSKEIEKAMLAAAHGRRLIDQLEQLQEHVLERITGSQSTNSSSGFGTRQ